MRFSPFIRSSVFAAMLTVASIVLTGCPNSFSEFAQKTSDEALLFQAQMYADDRDWDNAITTVNRMTTAGQANRATKYFLASAYAGRCGLDLLDFADAMTGLGSSTLYPFLLNEFKANTATNLADCQLAEDKIFSISTTYSSLSADENVLLAFLEMVKIGSLLASNAMVDPGNDGTYDGDVKNGGAVDPCDETATEDLTDTEIGRLGASVMIAYNALTASGSDLASDLGSISSICASVGGCDVQDEADFSAAELTVLRGLMKSNEIGFNSCGGSYGSTGAGEANDCHCPTIP